MPKPIYAIGHRNPDTDSICAAIAYAYLKRAAGEDVLPARAGKINQETKFVLDQFHIPMPMMIDDLYPRVQDVMIGVPATVRPSDTLRELGEIMRRTCAKSIPVVEQNEVLVGMVSGGDLAKRYFDELELQDLCETGMDFSGVLRALGGRLAVDGDLSRQVTGKVRIAAAKTETMRTLIRAGDVVLVGDRANAQEACIRIGVACLVITGNSSVGPEVAELARNAGVIIIEAPHDTFTCGRLINQSIPVRMIMQDQPIFFRPDQLLGDIRETIVKTNHRTYPVVENNHLIGLITRDRLIVPEREKVILIDHNERNQAVEGIEEAQLVEIIDHHRLGGLITSEPIFIRHEPVGSTATIVASMYQEKGVPIPPDMAGILLAAIVSDTVLFKSPTATAKDAAMAEKLAAIAGLNVEDFGMSVLKAGSIAGGMPSTDLIRNDLKEFNIGEWRVAISQISVMDAASIMTRREELRGALEEACRSEGYNSALLMVTDIMKEETFLLYAGQTGGMLRQAFGEEAEPGLFYLPGVMSRKKQVVPPLSEAARQKL